MLSPCNPTIRPPSIKLTELVNTTKQSLLNFNFCAYSAINSILYVTICKKWNKKGNVTRIRLKLNFLYKKLINRHNVNTKMHFYTSSYPKLLQLWIKNRKYKSLYLFEYSISFVSCGLIFWNKKQRYCYTTFHNQHLHCYQKCHLCFMKIIYSRPI